MVFAFLPVEAPSLFCCASCRAAILRLYVKSVAYIRNAPDDCGLARARSARYHRDSVFKRRLHRPPLIGVQLDSVRRLKILYERLKRRGNGGRLLVQPDQRARNVFFYIVIPRKSQSRFLSVLETARHKVEYQVVYRFLVKLRPFGYVVPQKLAHRFFESLLLNNGIARLFRPVFETINYARAQTELAVLAYAHAACDSVRRQKTDSVHVVYKPIRIAFQYAFRLVLVNAIYLYCRVEGNIVALQKHNLLLHGSVLIELLSYGARFFQTDSAQLGKPFGRIFQHGKSIVAE